MMRATSRSVELRARCDKPEALLVCSKHGILEVELVHSIKLYHSVHKPSSILDRIS